MKPGFPQEKPWSRRVPLTGSSMKKNYGLGLTELTGHGSIAENKTEKWLSLPRGHR